MHDEIARRAYELYCEDRYENGHDLDHWLRAEQELRATPAVESAAKPTTLRSKTPRSERAPIQSAADRR
jgi:hypothetical protein